jgi:hypothetical protein
VLLNCYPSLTGSAGQFFVEAFARTDDNIGFLRTGDAVRHGRRGIHRRGRHLAAEWHLDRNAVLRGRGVDCRSYNSLARGHRVRGANWGDGIRVSAYLDDDGCRPSAERSPACGAASWSRRV